jgi:myosin heavy subunit
LLFYYQAESALAFACHQEIEPQLALENWLGANRQLLNFQRRHRQRALLLDMDATIRQPQALLDVCQRIGLTLKALLPNTTPIPDQDFIERHLAHYLVASNPEVQSLHAELEASAHPLDEVPPLEIQIQPLELFSKQRQRMAQQREQQQELDKTVKKLQIAEHSLKEQNTQQLQLQAHLDQLTLARDEQLKLNSQHQAKFEKIQQEHQTLNAKNKEITQENELLFLQLHQVQEELGKISQQKQQLEQQAQKDQLSQQQYQTKIDQLTQARDKQVKLNTQLQTKIDKVQQEHQTLNAKNKEITQENELLFLQLHQVQEELEKTFLLRKPLDRQAHQLIETAKNGNLQELEQLKKELLSKEREIEKYHLRETKLKQTLSWKITAPIRAIAKPFKKMNKVEMKIQKQINLLRNCNLFDEAWYNATNEDVMKDGYDPVKHYVLFGATEGRNPSPVFNTLHYLENNPDVAEAGMNPLVHYVQYGMTEKRHIG